MIDFIARARELARQQLAEARVTASRMGASDEDIARAAEVQRLARLAEATRGVAEAQRQAEEVERRAAARDRAVAAHAEAVEREADRIAGAATVLEASRKRLTSAIKTADKALATLVAAGVEHDALVAQLAGEMRAAGLVAEYRDGDDVVTFDTGGTPAEGLVLAGRWWTRLNPVSLAWRNLYGALCGHLGTEFRGSREIRYGRGVDRLARQTAGLLDGCPLPAAHVREVPSWREEVDAIRADVEADYVAAHTPTAQQIEDHEREQARDERDARDTQARLKRRIAQCARTGEPVLS